MREGLSASDVALLSGRNNDGFGYGEGSWIWIIVFLIFEWGGFGNNGFGNRGNGFNGIADNYVLATDFAALERKLDGINNGICDSTFALNNTITNGFAATQQTLCQGFSGINQNIVTNGYETRLGIQGLSSQLANCCCDLKQGQSAINYNMAMNTNAIQNAMCLNTRDIIDSQNNGTRAILDAITQNKLEMKNDRIAELESQVSKLQLSASQSAQNAYLLSELKPCPSAAYIVPNPNCCYNYQVTQGCGCGNY